MSVVTAYIDGASIGNPGKAGVGYLLYKNNKLINKESVYIGIQSNNFAEYMALIFALLDIVAKGEKSCCVYTDSKLVSEQLNGNFKVKHQNIVPLYILAKKIISGLDSFEIKHIMRQKNKEADELAKEAVGFLAHG